MKKIFMWLIVLAILVGAGYYFYSSRLTQNVNEESAIDVVAQAFCDDSDVAEVRVEGDVIAVVSSVPGSGASYYTAQGKLVESCPLVSPGYETPSCGARSGGEGVSQIICNNFSQ